MLEKTTIDKIIKEIFSANGKITDKSINGNCSKCGECCTNFLPVSKKECYKITEYVLKNNIIPQKHMLVMRNLLTCPYYDGKKCLIYEVRPLICREFYCYKQASMELAEKFKAEKFSTIYMWDFANELEKVRRELKNE